MKLSVTFEHNRVYVIHMVIIVWCGVCHCSCVRMI